MATKAAVTVQPRSVLPAGGGACRVGHQGRDLVVAADGTALLVGLPACASTRAEGSGVVVGVRTGGKAAALFDCPIGKASARPPPTAAPPPERTLRQLRVPC